MDIDEQGPLSAYLLTGVHISESHTSPNFPWEWCFVGVDPRETPEARPNMQLGVYYHQPDGRGFTSYKNCVKGAIQWILENRPDLVAAARIDEAENLRHTWRQQ